MSNQNNIDELIPQYEIDKAKELGKGLSDLKSIVVELVKESNKLRIGSFDGKTLNDTVAAQKKATEAMNELGLSTRVYNNLKKIENELTQVGKDSIEEATLQVRKLTIERNALNLKTQEGAVKQKELNKQIDEFNKFIMKNKDSLAQQRMNIGNYASAFEGLRFNVTQVVRELPSLNNGFNVFASAISNNLPMVAADIGRLVQINKELIAQGKPTQSAFAAIAGSIFSWQTALIVGLTMLPKVIDSLLSGGEAARKAAEANKSYKSTLEQIDQAAIKTAETEITRLRVLTETATNTANTQEKRLKASKDLQNLYPQLLASYSQEAILNGDAANAIRSVTEALLSRAKATAAENKLAESANNEYLLLLEYRKLDLELTQKLNQQKNTKDDTGVTYALLSADIGELRKKIQDNRALRLESKLEQEQYLKDIQSFSNQVGDTLNKPTQVGKETIITKSGKDAEEADDKVLMLQRDLKEVLDLANASLDRVPHPKEVTPNINKQVVDENKLQKQRLQNLYDLHRATTTVMDSIEQMSSNKAEKDLARLDEESKRIEKSKDRQIAALDRLGLTQEQYDDKKADIEARAEQRQAQIAQQEASRRERQAEFEKEMAILKATIALYVGIAQEIEKGGVIGIATGAAVAAYMATVIATLSSEKVPQYYKGREGGKAEIAIVGEQGTEAIVDKKGNLRLTPDKATLTYLQEGDSVIPNYKLNEISNEMTLPKPKSNTAISRGADSAIVNELRAMRMDFKNIPQTQYVFDNGEWRKYVINGSSRTKYLNSVMGR